MRKLVVLFFLFLGACATPPKPPVVDGSIRTPINSIKPSETIGLPAAVKKTGGEQTNTSPPLLHKFSILFPYNSTQFTLSEDVAAELLPLLVSARRIEVRGRTDGYHHHAADEKIALNRALAAQRFLIEQGVAPAIISVNYVSAGDYVADNASAIGRSQNRRVDIVVFNK